MATDKSKKPVVTETEYNNVFREELPESERNENKKRPIEYGQDFDGSEFAEFAPEPFDAFGKIMRINSAALSKKISDYFKQIFHELAGCNVFIYPNTTHIGVEMFFEHNTEDLPKGKMMNLEFIASKSKDTYETVQMISNKIRGKLWGLNNETKLILSRFMFGGKNANMPDNSKVWNNKEICREVHISAYGDPYYRNTRNVDRVFVRVANLDIRRILAEIFGKMIIYKTIPEESSDVNYRAEARYDVKVMQQRPDGTFIMNITQFDYARTQQYFIEENPVSQQYYNGGIVMY